MRYFNLTFIPSLFPSLNITNQYYSVFTSDVSFLGNSPLILLLIVAVSVYLVVAMLSSKRLISNKYVRKLFKRIRKYRVKYGLLLDVCWAVYPYAIFISLLQFKMGSMSTTTGMLNIAFSALTFIVLNSVAGYTFYLAYKYNKTP
jgi:hypothetical protein